MKLFGKFSEISDEHPNFIYLFIFTGRVAPSGIGSDTESGYPPFFTHLIQYIDLAKAKSEASIYIL